MTSNMTKFYAKVLAAATAASPAFALFTLS
jgi:hypothetical protein